MVLGRSDELDSGKLVADNGQQGLFQPNRLDRVKWDPGWVVSYPRFSNREMMGPTRPR